MAFPKCVKCDSTMFELQKFEPRNSRFVLYSINCSACGGVVGVLEYSNTAAMIETLEKKVKGLESMLRDVGHTLDRLVRATKA